MTIAIRKQTMVGHLAGMSLNPRVVSSSPTLDVEIA